MENISKRQRLAISSQMKSLRDALWPNLDENRLWMRSKSDGWLSVPRPMPLLLQIMDNLTKGKPVSAVYLDLWCRTYDDSFVVVNKSREMAFFSGFMGERAERTWMTRIRTLEKLKFIEVQDGPNGPISYVLILNPYHAVKMHFDAGHVDVASFNALKQRMIEIRARDLENLEKKAGESAKPINRPAAGAKLKMPKPFIHSGTGAKRES